MEIPKTRICRKCQKQKPLNEFVKAIRCFYGRSHTCSTCQKVINLAWKKGPGRRKYQAIRARFRLTVKGIADKLRSHHGFSTEESLFWAEKLKDPYTRCKICGLPERIRAAYQAKGWTSLQFGRRLTLDRIDSIGEYVRENLRILCSRCNTVRGPEWFSDEVVLLKVRRWYESRGFTEQELWWFSTSPGKGGLSRLGTERIHDQVLTDS